MNSKEIYEQAMFVILSVTLSSKESMAEYIDKFLKQYANQRVIEELADLHKELEDLKSKQKTSAERLGFNLATLEIITKLHKLRETNKA